MYYLQENDASFTYHSEDTFRINNIDLVKSVDQYRNHIQIVFDDGLNTPDQPNISKKGNAGYWICIFYDFQKCKLYWLNVIIAVSLMK